jgi:hypothetical protein
MLETILCGLSLSRMKHLSVAHHIPCHAQFDQTGGSEGRVYHEWWITHYNRRCARNPINVSGLARSLSWEKGGYHEKSVERLPDRSAVCSTPIVIRSISIHSHRQAWNFESPLSSAFSIPSLDHRLLNWRLFRGVRGKRLGLGVATKQILNIVILLASSKMFRNMLHNIFLLLRDRSARTRDQLTE